AAAWDATWRRTARGGRRRALPRAAAGRGHVGGGAVTVGHQEPGDESDHDQHRHPGADPLADGAPAGPEAKLLERTHQSLLDERRVAGAERRRACAADPLSGVTAPPKKTARAMSSCSSRSTVRPSKRTWPFSRKTARPHSWAA